MFNELMYRFSKFMQGRYGVDSLSRFLSVVLLVIIVLGLFIRIPFSGLITLALLIILYWRMFSRNIPKRYEENQKFLHIRDKFLGRFSSFGSNLSQMREQPLPDEGLSYLQMPAVQSEDPHSERKRAHYGSLSAMRIRIPQKELKRTAGHPAVLIYLRKKPALRALY